MQEVPTTPQLGALLVQEDDGFNQRVPSQEFYLQDDGIENRVHLQIKNMYG